jgi:hypothetical protein
MATIKKAQYGDRITSRQKKRLGRISEKNPERAKEVAERMKLRATRRKRGSELYDSLSPKEDIPAFKARTLEEAKKAKNGKSFPDLNKDGKITKADILKGRGVIAKKGANIKKAQKGKKITPTADSTDFFEKRADRYDKAAGRLIRAGGYESVLRMKKVADQARDDAWRQGFKGKPGYDANGFPIPTKKKNAPKKKMQYGGAAASMKPTSKIKKAQAGLVASNKRVGPSDPYGAWTKVQEMNLPPRNVKTKVSLTRDKQLGATKMMKMGGKAKAKKK